MKNAVGYKWMEWGGFIKKKTHAHRWIPCSGYGKHTHTSLLGTTSYRKSFHTRKKHKNDHRIFFWKIVIFECGKYHWGKKYHCTHTCIRRTQKDERKGNRDKSFSAKRAIKARKIISQANFSYFIAHCCKHQTARPSLEKHWQNWENVTKVKMGKHYHPYPRCDLANVEKNACRWNKNVLRIFLLWNPALVSRKLFETKFCSGGNSRIDRWW